MMMGAMGQQDQGPGVTVRTSPGSMCSAGKFMANWTQDLGQAGLDQAAFNRCLERMNQTIQEACKYAPYAQLLFLLSPIGFLFFLSGMLDIGGDDYEPQDSIFPSSSIIGFVLFGGGAIVGGVVNSCVNTSARNEIVTNLNALCQTLCTEYPGVEFTYVQAQGMMGMITNVQAQRGGQGCGLAGMAMGVAVKIAPKGAPQVQAQAAPVAAYAQAVGVATPAAPPAGGGGSDMASQLQQLASLRDQGILSEDEFSQAKGRLLASP